MINSVRLLAIFGLILLLSCKDNGVSSGDEGKEYDTPQEMVADMMRGINLGNTLEPPLEGDWNNGPAQEYYFDEYRDAGFSTVRVPVRWDEHTTDSAPYQVDEQWMDRVESVVDWGLERNLFVILNTHHEEWIKQNYTEANKARFDSIWAQISERFQDKSSRLLFEIINEPFGMTKGQVDEINAKTLSTIRKTNPTRVVIYSGRDYSGFEYLSEAEIPDDDYLMGYYHNYNPWSFAGEGEGTWGTAGDIAGVRASFEQVANWSETHNIPVILSEFGAIRDTDYNSQMLYYFTFVESAIAYNVPFQAWDDGGMFKIMERDQKYWLEIKDILIYTYPNSPNEIGANKVSSGTRINWNNRLSGDYSLEVQRRTNGIGRFTTIAELDAGTSSYLDEETEANTSYDYRIIAESEDGTLRYSYPYRVN
jgi:hypothetical protein